MNKVSYIKFLNDPIKKNASVKKISANVIQISGVTQNLSGFHIVNSNGEVLGKYEDYTTLYRTIDGGFQLSNDGSVYGDSEESIPHEITLDEVKESKVAEMNTAQQAAIEYGVDVQLTDGTTEHFSLTQYDQQSLMGLQSLVASGEESIPWHNSDETEHCKFYSNADMQKIIESALSYVTFHVTWFRDLRIYIRSLTDIESVQAITYNTEIPVQYQSEVLQMMLMQNGGAS